MRTLFFVILLAITAQPLTAAAGVPYTSEDGATPAPNVINLTATFENDSAVPTADARMNLDKLGVALSDSRLAGQKSESAVIPARATAAIKTWRCRNGVPRPSATI